MVFPKTVWLVIAAALLISSIGFKKYVWFISLGYGFSIAGIGILLLALYGGRLTVGTAICCVLFVLYGFRLGGYLLYREVKSSAYNSKMKTEIKDGKSMTFGVKCAIWGHVRAAVRAAGDAGVLPPGKRRGHGCLVHSGRGHHALRRVL